MLKLTDEEVMEIKELRDQGMQWKQIAEIYKHNKTYLSSSYNAIAKEKGITKPKTEPKKMDLNRIINLKGKGLSYKEIAVELGTTYQVVKNTVYRAKLSGTSSSKKSFKERKEQKVKNNEKIEALVEKYTNSPLTKTAMSKDNEGRASAVNTFLARCMAVGNMVDVENINSLYAAFESYIRLCTECDCPITLMSVCVALGINKNILNNWKTGKRRENDSAYKEFAENVFYAVQAGIETCMAAGLINPVVGIWWEKAHFREIEADKTEVQNDSPLDRQKSAQEIIEEYEGMVLPD